MIYLWKLKGFSFEYLTEDQKKIYKNIEEVVIGNKEEIENLLGKDISEVVYVVVYTLFNESVEFDSKILTEIAYYI